jgi:F-type H+-transporting ATPase subunit gamma
VKAIADILASAASDSPLTTRLVGVSESPSNVLVLVIVADRGLAGAYNSNVLRVVERLIRSGSGQGRNFRLVAVGKKAQAYFRFRHQDVERQFTGLSDRPTYEDARQIAAAIVPAFLKGDVDLVQVVSTRLRSVGSQAVETRQLLPVLVDQDGPPAPSSDAAMFAAGDGESPKASSKLGFFEFEPDVEQLLAQLVPRYSEAAIYGALLEASASEHASRQRAMAAATENAEELLKTLTRIMNRARQDAITTEIIEIVGGSEALRSAQDMPHDLTHPQATEEQNQ